ncbi:MULTISPECIES: serine/threonine-protein kinase [unclassified Corallococcus]|uniref:serine/threonine-protein kinase n=1 Tax=unclassified Corallococcus TaxID=2685029 RepID=UPI001CBDE7A3|nr:MULTISPECIES: serine/threonine-protein kinase [unclassified Corallococcus]MBZ4334478.1 serine/threonine protein kinase [Corallococcus sp. AS-1-12]MBZ4374643.1 serine/threonine protein kinase [Corallococcus sp. AS-1-6]
MMPPPAILSPGAEVLGYTVEHPLGQGGFGTVYLARNAGQPFALKLLHLPRVGERVEREVSILLKLRHPHVVGLQGYGLWPPGAPRFAVIVMEYVDGRRLDVWAEEENPTARQVARVVLDVARALGASHAVGVLHRDVKEANVMVRASDGVAKLVDFGIGDYEGARSLTVDILPPGTPEYRAPEAWRFFRQHVRVPGARYEAGPSDDLWALGLVLYSLLTARQPFDGADEPGFIEAVVSREPVPPHEENPRAPRALGDVCMRLLEKTPETRTMSALAAVTELERVLADADATWDVPLCDAYGEDTATTEGGRDSEDRWMHAPLHRPRRGRRVPPARATPSAPGTEPEPTSRTHGSPWGIAVTLLLVLAVALWLWPSRSPGVSRVRQEVAASGKSPQAARAAAPTGPEATAAAVAFPATLQEESATVTTPPKDTQPLQLPLKPAKKGMGVMARAVSTAAACTALACPGPQVRQPPPPEPCPVGAVTAMEKRGVDIGDKQPARFAMGDPRIISIGEGPVEVRLIGHWVGLPGKSVLSGRSIVRDRVYVRFNWATTPQGDSFPVCFDVHAEEGPRGMAREAGDDSPSRARIWTIGDVKAVAEFE